MKIKRTFRDTERAQSEKRQIKIKNADAAEMRPTSMRRRNLGLCKILCGFSLKVRGVKKREQIKRRRNFLPVPEPSFKLRDPRVPIRPVTCVQLGAEPISKQKIGIAINVESGGVTLIRLAETLQSDQHAAPADERVDIFRIELETSIKTLDRIFR